MSPHKKTKLISIHILKPSHFRTPQKNHVNSDPCTLIKSISIAHAEVKSISTIHTKTKSRLMLIIKPSDFRPAHKTQGNFDHPHKNQVKRSLHEKQVTSRPAKKQANHYPRTETKTISIHIWKPSESRLELISKISLDFARNSQFRYPHCNQGNFDSPHKHQVYFDPITEMKFISIPTLVSRWFSCPGIEPSQLWPGR